MVGLAQLVNDSLARHGIETQLDPSRVQWSKWFRIEDSFSVLLVPSAPGLFALAEETIRAGESAIGGGKRMLALFEISQTEDLGMALGRLFLPGAPQRDRLQTGKCFVRFAVIEDDHQRKLAYKAFEVWISSSAEAASGIPGTSPPPLPLEASPASGTSNNQARNGPPGPFPSGF